MAIRGFGDFNDIFGHVDRMMNSVMRNVFSPMADPFGMMGSMSPGIHNIMNVTNMAHTGSYVSSSSVMITNDGSGRPQVYQQTKTARYGPGGVAETQETVSDSASGVQKLAIGHHINDRGHVMEKSKNWYTGEEEEKDDYINLEEEEGQAFEDEWKSQMGAAYAAQRRYQADRALTSGQTSGPLAITAGSSNYHQHQPMAGPSNYPSYSVYEHQPQPQQQPQPHANAQHHRHPQLHQHQQLLQQQQYQHQTQNSSAASSTESPSRHRVPSKQRSKKDKKPYKRSKGVKPCLQ